MKEITFSVAEPKDEKTTKIPNFNVKFNVSTGTDITIQPNSLATAMVKIPGVRKGDPILVTPQDGEANWTIYSAWVSSDDTVKVKLANYTEKSVAVLGSQYKVVVIK